MDKSGQMKKIAYLELRRQTYHLAGTIGHYAETSGSKTLEDIYISLSDVVDQVDKLCVEEGILHPETLEILKTGSI